MNKSKKRGTRKLCEFEYCRNIQRARGLCANHYARFIAKHKKKWLHKGIDFHVWGIKFVEDGSYPLSFMAHDYLEVLRIQKALKDDARCKIVRIKFIEVR